MRISEVGIAPPRGLVLDTWPNLLKYMENDANGRRSFFHFIFYQVVISRYIRQMPMIEIVESVATKEQV